LLKLENRTQELCYRRVSRWLRDAFGDQVTLHADAPLVGIWPGTAYVQVGVQPWGDGDAVIRVLAYVVFEAPLSLELAKFLLQENDRMIFGAFSIDADGDIAFSNTLMGSTCLKEELLASVFAVGYAADDYDERIVERFGGQRAVDRIQSGG
jgi:hypothetical protein